MSDISKTTLTFCMALGGASLSGIMYSFMVKENEYSEIKNLSNIESITDGSGVDIENNKSNTDGTNVSQDTELTVDKSNDTIKTCKCPFANTFGACVTGGVISGAISWYLF